MPPRTHADPSQPRALHAPIVEPVQFAGVAAQSEPSVPVAAVVAMSVLAHLAVVVALGTFGHAVSRLRPEIPVEVMLLAPAAPAPAPSPEPVVAPEVVEPATPTPVVRARPTPVPTPVAPEPEPPAEPTVAPPSLDDVFGREPAPAAEVMAAAAGGGPSMDLGAPGGLAGGRGAGAGSAVGSSIGGAGNGTGGEAGPSEADRRRARRAYVRSLEGMLGGRVRYPRALERAGVGGRVELCVRIGTDGRVLGARVCSSAGHGQLDDAALDAAHALDRVPAPPVLAAWSPSDEIHAGIVFAVR